MTRDTLGRPITIKGLSESDRLDQIIRREDRFGLYQRGPNDFSRLPLRRHYDYAARGWTLVEVLPA